MPEQRRGRRSMQKQETRGARRNDGGRQEAGQRAGRRDGNRAGSRRGGRQGQREPR